MLPQQNQVGNTRIWELPKCENTTMTLNLTLLGMGSSQTQTHDGHPASKYQKRGLRCSACRWFEARIFRDPETGRYMAHRVGMSIVPGETPHPAYSWHDTEEDVVHWFLSYPVYDAVRQAFSDRETA